jgi:transcriptional regulator with XRE-family HTH domain
MAEDQVPAPPPPPPPASFGEEMRRQREIRGISLKEIADSTKISKRYLEAIEKNQYGTLPAPVFTRGFVREYARYLGLNPDEAVNRYLHYRQELEQSGQPGRELKRETPRDIAREPLREMRHETARETLRKIQAGRDVPSAEQPAASAGLRVALFLLILAAFIAVIWLLRNPQVWRRQAPPQPPGTTNETVAQVLAPTAPAPTQPQSDQLVLRVRATENSWIGLEADGRSIFNSELRAGEEQTFHAKDRFVFRSIGNAGGIVVTLNNVEVPSLGRSGEVIRNRVFDRGYLTQRSGGEGTQ